MRHPHVYTIPPGAPFLDTLVGAVLDGRLIEGFRADEPFALADLTIYLPTRRAARAIRERFLARLGRPLLLPRIHTLGDIDEDEGAALDLDAPELPAAASAMERKLVLAQLVLSWSGALVRAAAGFPDEELVVPSSPADAARLATRLGVLMDQVGAGREAWDGLFAAQPADLARYWDITLEFLKIATEFWPAHLAERGLIDPGTRRDLAIRAEAERLATHGSPAPVIAAGSTGSVPATAALLAAIARLDNGAVVLPGLDLTLDAEAWAEIGPSDREPAGAGHPQYGLKLLLQGLGVRREDVEPLVASPGELAIRERFVSEAMRPAGTTERWASDPVLSAEEKAASLARVVPIEAANEREEALSIAVLLRLAVETPGTVVALVTPERGLARRVAVELKRWGIEVDDSAGRPLGRTPPGVLARLVAETALGGAPAETLLALAKHPLAAFGLASDAARHAARALERAVLRGPRLKPGTAALIHALEGAREERFRKRAEGEYPSRTDASRDLTSSDWAEAGKLAQRIGRALELLERLADSNRTARLADLVAAHAEAIEAVARDDSGLCKKLYADEAGEALAALFEELAANAHHFAGALAPRDYPGLFAALIESAAVRRRGGADPRVHIWGTLEARLQSVDTIVLGGLNEGTWPGQTRSDPLLSRPMRQALSLEPPERRIGLAAHDFSQAFGHAQVWLTRAARQDGEPKVASRWLQRLRAHAGKDLAKAMAARGESILRLARTLDTPERLDPPKRPQPSPPVALRPRKISATRIETLIRDPYAIYAREVLRLRPFESIARQPDAAERGTLIHDILETFIRERPVGPFDAGAVDRLIAIGREEFARHEDFPEVHALWWPRFERIARWLVGIEATRPHVAHRHVENYGEIAITPAFTLSARADRLDRLADGSLAIIDYKTGSPPAMNKVLALSPQLPLQGLIARRGGFRGVEPAEPSALAYYKLSGRGEGGEEHDRSFRPARSGKPEVTLAQALAQAETRLNALVAAFADPDAQYVSRKIPESGRVYVGDYDHLARVAEWVASDEEVDIDAP